MLVYTAVYITQLTFQLEKTDVFHCALDSVFSLTFTFDFCQYCLLNSDCSAWGRTAFCNCFELFLFIMKICCVDLSCYSTLSSMRRCRQIKCKSYNIDNKVRVFIACTTDAFFTDSAREWKGEPRKTFRLL